MGPHVLFIYNHRAGLHGGPWQPLDVVRRMQTWNWRVTPMRCRGADSVTDVRRALMRDIDLVVAAGGDGTLHLVANGMVGTDVPLGIIPRGTGNDFARGLGLPLEPEAALEIVRTGVSHAVDLGRITEGRTKSRSRRKNGAGREGENGGGESSLYFLNVAAIGLSADVASAVTPEYKQRWGRFAYVLEAGRRLRGGNTLHLGLRVDDGPVEKISAWQLSIANGVSFGGGFRVAREAAVDEGLLDIVVMEPGLGRIVRDVVGGEGTMVERAGSRHYRGRRVLLLGNRRLRLNLDGELQTMRSPIEIAVVRGALNVLVPAGQPNDG